MTFGGMIGNDFEEKTLRDWQRFLADSKELPTRGQLNKFIESQMVHLESMEKSFKGPATNSHSTPEKTEESSSHQLQTAVDGLRNDKKSSSSNVKSCTHCSQNHFIGYCDKFRALEVPERIKSIQDRLCSR